MSSFAPNETMLELDVNAAAGILARNEKTANHFLAVVSIPVKVKID